MLMCSVIVAVNPYACEKDGVWKGNYYKLVASKMLTLARKIDEI